MGMQIGEGHFRTLSPRTGEGASPPSYEPLFGVSYLFSLPSLGQKDHGGFLPFGRFLTLGRLVREYALE